MGPGDGGEGTFCKQNVPSPPSPGPIKSSKAFKHHQNKDNHLS